MAYGLVASSRLRRDTPPLHQDLFRGHSSAPFCRSAAHRAAYDDARARSDWCCTPWAPILLQVSAQGLLPREGRNPRLLREDHVHDDDRTPKLRRRRPRRTIPSAWGVDAMGGSMVGGRTAQRSRGGVSCSTAQTEPSPFVSAAVWAADCAPLAEYGGDGVLEMKDESTKVVQHLPHKILHFKSRLERE